MTVAELIDKLLAVTDQDRELIFIADVHDSGDPDEYWTLGFRKVETGLHGELYVMLTEY